MTSPMHAVHERSTRHVAPRPPLACEVYVSNGTVTEGWYAAELLEWTEFPSLGWTGVARYRTSVSGGWVGRFSAEHVRNLNPPD